MHISQRTKTIRSNCVDVSLQFNVPVLTHLPLHGVDDILWSLVTACKHLNRLHETLVVEIHMVLNRLHLFDNVFCEELRERSQFLPIWLVQDHNQASSLLQVLYLCSDQVLICLDSNDWYTIVSHICDNLRHQFSQLVMTSTFAAMRTFQALRRYTTYVAALPLAISSTWGGPALLSATFLAWNWATFTSVDAVPNLWVCIWVSLHAPRSRVHIIYGREAWVRLLPRRIAALGRNLSVLFELS